MTKSTAKGAIPRKYSLVKGQAGTKQNRAKQNESEKSQHTEVQQDATGDSAVDGLGGLDLSGL